MDTTKLRRWPKVTLFTLITLTISLISAPAFADVFEAWDEGDDDAIQSEEFAEYDDTLYDDWDENNDDVLSENEVDGGIFESWDDDDDGSLAENEWNDDGWFSDFGSYGDVDANGDGNIDEDEFADYDHSYYDTWDDDDDASLTGDEFGNGLFASWDDNDDNALNDDEFLL